MNYPKAREEFIGLKHQEKKERLVRLLQIFVGNGKIFDDLINLAQKEQTSENQLIEIYESVVNAMDEVMKGNMNDGRQTRKSQKIHRQSPSTRSPRSCPRRPRGVVEKFVK